MKNENLNFVKMLSDYIIENGFRKKFIFEEFRKTFNLKDYSLAISEFRKFRKWVNCDENLIEVNRIFLENQEQILKINESKRLQFLTSVNDAKRAIPSVQDLNVPIGMFYATRVEIG